MPILDRFFAAVAAVVRRGDFTLGAELDAFEGRFASLCGVPHAVGVASGTDALILSMRLLGIGPGDEVITTPMTFIATVGAIVATGARPVFVDSEDGFVIDPGHIEAAITWRTKAIMPVHYTGNVADMPAVAAVARRHNLAIVEDACQALLGAIDGRPVGSWGATACFSLHPLKNLNIWGDGGLIVTRSADLATRLRLMRNHGLVKRDEVAVFGVNSRLDAIQAAIGNVLIDDVARLTARRVAIAGRYDEAFAGLEPEVRAPRRRAGVHHVFHLYMVRAARRNGLLAWLQQRGIEAKVHYPVPVHLQPAGAALGYKAGDFPVCERDCSTILTLPAHPYLSDDEVDYTIEQVRAFCQRG